MNSGPWDEAPAATTRRGRANPRRGVSVSPRGGWGPAPVKKDDPQSIPERAVALTAGPQIGSSQIVSALGAGGMKRLRPRRGEDGQIRAEASA
jgi:hypothetical protein